MTALRNAGFWAAGILSASLLTLTLTDALSPTYRWMVRYFAPEVWSAIGTWATVVIAIVAGVYAKRQVDIAKATREEIAQPNVALYAELNKTDWQVIELVVKNFGNTPAYNITFDFKENPLKRTPITSERGINFGGDVVPMYFPSEISYLAPGQDWRTVWDHSDARRQYIADANRAHDNNPPNSLTLSKKHDVDINFKDSHGKTMPTVPCFIDFEIFDETTLLQVKTMDDLVTIVGQHTQALQLLLAMSVTAQPTDQGNRSPNS